MGYVFTIRIFVLLSVCLLLREDLVESCDYRRWYGCAKGKSLGKAKKVKLKEWKQVLYRQFLKILSRKSIKQIKNKRELYSLDNEGGRSYSENVISKEIPVKDRVFHESNLKKLMFNEFTFDKTKAVDKRLIHDSSVHDLQENIQSRNLRKRDHIKALIRKLNELFSRKRAFEEGLLTQIIIFLEQKVKMKNAERQQHNGNL